MSDWRNIREGRRIVGEGYADQPYVVQTDDGAWLCCVTLSGQIEGSSDQHVATFRSMDQGHTWENEVRLEEPGAPENSYAVMLKADNGRVYIFYDRNTDNIREIPFHDRSNTYTRVDSLGHYVFRYSDDNGKSWSKDFYDVPVRDFKCDRDNVFQGKVRFFWNVGRPFKHNGIAYMPLSKVGEMGRGFYQQSEGALIMSDNILTEKDPAKINWVTLPDGEYGLRTPPGGGPISEEHSYVVLSDGSICASYRSIDGYSVECYSRDGGHTWELPHYKRFASGNLAKHPRAANFIWKMQDGRYLYWFHNHGGPVMKKFFLYEGKRNPYMGRNPVWLCGGIEVDTPRGKEISWQEPHVFIYDKNRHTRISYPDFWEENGKYYVSETQKDTARVHEIPKEYIESLFLPPKGQLLAEGKGGQTLDMPHFSKGESSIIRMSFDLQSDEAGEWCKALDGENLGFRVSFTQQRQIMLQWLEPERQAYINSQVLPDKVSTAEVIIDTGPGIAYFKCNGILCDGGTEMEFGWKFYDADMQCLDWAKQIALSPNIAKFTITLETP